MSPHSLGHVAGFAGPYSQQVQRGDPLEAAGLQLGDSCPNE